MPNVDKMSNPNNRVDVSADYNTIPKPSCMSSTKTNNQTKHKDTTEMQKDLTLPSTSRGIHYTSETLTRSNKNSITKGKKF